MHERVEISLGRDDLDPCKNITLQEGIQRKQVGVFGGSTTSNMIGEVGHSVVGK